MYNENLNLSIFINRRTKLKPEIVPNFIKEKLIELYLPYNSINYNNKSIIKNLLYVYRQKVKIYTILENSRIYFNYMYLRRVELQDISNLRVLIFLIAIYNRMRCYDVYRGIKL